MAELSKRERTPVEKASAEQLVSPGNAFSPDVNIYDDGDALIFTMDIPGVHKGDISIEIDENNVMSVRALASFKESEARPIRREFEVGNYYRAFTLSNEFDKDKVSGVIENGVLQVMVPRREDVKPRKIKINA